MTHAVTHASLDRALPSGDLAINARGGGHRAGMKRIGALGVAAFAVLAGLAGCSSEEETELSDALDIVASKPPKNQPVITAVTTDDGFTQVRQNATVTLVIRGKKLGHTTRVTVGGVDVRSIDSVKPREVRVTAFVGAWLPLGPTDVTVISAHDTTTAPGAFELTPFVVSPTGAGGHGTFQSPMGLCDADLQSFSDWDSTVLLLPGTHRCGHQIVLAFATLAGDPDQPTIITGDDTGGFGMFAFTSSAPSIIRDLTFAPPLAEWSINAGNLDVERVVDAGGIIAGDGSLVKLDHYTYEGEGTAVDVFTADITSSTIRHCGSGDGIVVHAASNGPGVTVDQTVIEDCARGIHLAGPGGFGRVFAEIARSQLLDNGIGIAADSAITTVRNTAIRGNDATPRASSTGISVGSGQTSLFDVEITGQTDVGLLIQHAPSDNQIADVIARGLHITGGLFGIAFGGIDNHLYVRNADIRDQTIASFATDNLDGQTDFGRPSDPGNNQLSVISGFAINDGRFSESQFSRYIFAFGTTLNGVSFDGQTIDGPAELAPFYRIASDSGIQF